MRTKEEYQEAFNRIFDDQTLEQIKENSWNNDTITHLVYYIDKEILFNDIVLLQELIDNFEESK